MKIEFEGVVLWRAEKLTVADATLAEVEALFDRLGLVPITKGVSVEAPAPKAAAAASPPPVPPPKAAKEKDPPKPPPEKPKDPPKEEPKPPPAEEPKKQLQLVPDPGKPKPEAEAEKPKPEKEGKRKTPEDDADQSGDKPKEEPAPAGDGTYDVKEALKQMRPKDLVEYLVKKAGIKDKDAVIAAVVELRDKHGHKALKGQKDLETRAGGLFDAFSE